MRYFYNLLIITLMVSWANTALAQDPHFSQFYIAPLTLNPALTGMQEGNIRVVGNHRRQWGSISQPFQTTSVSAEFNVLEGEIDDNLMGVGFMIFNDKAGSAGLQRTRLASTFAYSQNLGMEGAYLSVGFEGAFEQQRVTRTGLLFESQYDGKGLDGSINSGEDFVDGSIWNFDFSAGLAWTYTPDENRSFYIGGSMAHITRPNRSFFEGKNDPLDYKYTTYAGMELRVNGYVSLMPRAVFLAQGKYRELNMGGYVKLHVDASDFNLSVGGMYRLKDALIPMIRADYKAYGLGLSYDINISKLSTASNTRGGLELALIYKGITTGHPSSGKAIPCPDF